MTEHVLETGKNVRARSPLPETFDSLYFDDVENSKRDAASNSNDVSVIIKSHSNHLSNSRMQTKNKSRPDCCAHFKMCIIITIGIIILLGVTLFIIFPRVPEVNIVKIEYTSIYIPSGTIAQIKDGYLKIEADYNAYIFVNSSNYVSWTIEVILLNIFFPKQGELLIGTGNLTNVLIPSLSSTTLTFPIHIQYYSLYHSERKNVQDPLLVNMILQCNQEGILNVVMDIQISISLFSWLGIKPAFLLPAKIPCSIIYSDQLLASLSNI